MIMQTTTDHLFQSESSLTNELLGSVMPGWETVRIVSASPQGDLYLIRNIRKNTPSESLLQFTRVTMRELSDRFEGALPDPGGLTDLFKDAPNLVPLQDCHIIRNREECLCFLRMENMPALQSILPACEAGTVPESEVFKAALDICRALIFCHDAGVIHMGISPASIFIDPSGNYRLGYFDLLGKTLVSGSSIPKRGSISYVAPEQFSGRDCSSAVDVYSLGLVLYQLLNRGRVPFLPSAPLQYSTADIDNANYRRLHGGFLPAIPDADINLQGIIRKCCAIRPEDRYSSSRELYRALLSCLRPDLPDHKRLLSSYPETLPQPSVLPELPVYLKKTDTSQDIFPEDTEDNIDEMDLVPDSTGAGEYEAEAPESRIHAAPFVIAAAGLLLIIAGVAVFMVKKPPIQNCRPVLSGLSRSLSHNTIGNISDTGNRALQVIDETSIEIPDPVLKRAVLTALGISGNEVRVSDTRNVKELLLGNSDDAPDPQEAIVSLAGLESFPHLKKLSLCRMNISDTADLSALSRLQRLRTLDLHGNSLSSTDAVKGLRKLTWLDLSRNRISDLSSLQELTELKSLALYENEITDLSGLASLTGLQELYLDSNSITDITPLSNLRELETLRLDNNLVSDISPLRSNTSLGSLTLTGNQITDLSSLGEFSSVQELWLDNNPIGAFRDLSGMTDLLYLNLGNTRISDLSGLADLQSLEELVLSDNYIWDITPLGQLTGLVYLDLENNSISDLMPLAGLDSLETLYLGRNRISDIAALRGLTKLTTIALQDNWISLIDPLALLTDIQSLDLSGNSISSLTALNNYKNLTWLNVGSNSISDLAPLEGCTELETLQAYSNSITDLTPLRNMLKLKYLVLNRNSVSDLSALKNHQNLERLYIEYNNVTDVSVLTELKGLKKIYLAGNILSDTTVLDRFPETTDVYTLPQ